MIVTIQDFRVEFVPTKGKQGYNKGTIVYTTDRGEQREQRIMSFANPGVFDAIKALKFPAKVDVHITKNDKGYNEWAKVEPVSDEPASAPVSGNTKSGSVTTRSTYETPEERAAKQVLIVKQSCLAQAVAFEKDATREQVLETAQVFVDWVYATPTLDLFESKNDLPE